jgi:hypothetical protein
MSRVSGTFGQASFRTWFNPKLDLISDKVATFAKRLHAIPLIGASAEYTGRVDRNHPTLRAVLDGDPDARKALCDWAKHVASD